MFVSADRTAEPYSRMPMPPGIIVTILEIALAEVKSKHSLMLGVIPIDLKHIYKRIASKNGINIPRVNIGKNWLTGRFLNCHAPYISADEPAIKSVTVIVNNFK